MSFSADWLALRRSADLRARNRDIEARLSRHFSDRASLRILDLGSGTGANLDALHAALPAGQDWLLTDSDPTLLAYVPNVAGVRIATRVVDLAADLDGPFSPVPDLVTSSAFFDLAGAEWITEIVARTAASGAAFHTTLTYDGVESWQPGSALDAAVLGAFLDDQHSDKGLGPALGPDATAFLADAFRGHGYEVIQGDSAWTLAAPGDSALIAALAAGVAGAVRPALGQVADDWLQARSECDSVRIGHQDLLCLPAQR